MPQSLSQLWVHIIFSTKFRNKFLTNKNIRNKLFEYIKAICFKQRCLITSINGVEDHIHILLRLNKSVALSSLIEKIKISSSKWIKSIDGATHEIKNFYWQSGYAAFSVSQSNIEAVKLYIEKQEEHHRRYSYQDELRKILNRYEVQYNEKYLWD